MDGEALVLHTKYVHNMKERYAYNHYSYEHVPRYHSPSAVSSTSSKLTDAEGKEDNTTLAHSPLCYLLPYVPAILLLS